MKQLKFRQFFCKSMKDIFTAKCLPKGTKARDLSGNHQTLGVVLP